MAAESHGDAAGLRIVETYRSAASLLELVYSIAEAFTIEDKSRLRAILISWLNCDFRNILPYWQATRLLNHWLEHSTEALNLEPVLR
ncbi:hypothetical protein HDU67_001900 [Dinochytrium kinnereticum]|nr:hypothetical protein HDU67_001900 [Dinochytrium kinnereticum]